MSLIPPSPGGLDTLVPAKRTPLGPTVSLMGRVVIHLSGVGRLPRLTGALGLSVEHRTAFCGVAVSRTDADGPPGRVEMKGGETPQLLPGPGSQPDALGLGVGHDVDRPGRSSPWRLTKTGSSLPAAIFRHQIGEQNAARLGGRVTGTESSRTPPSTYSTRSCATPKSGRPAGAPGSRTASARPRLRRSCAPPPSRTGARGTVGGCAAPGPCRAAPSAPCVERSPERRRRPSGESATVNCH